MNKRVTEIPDTGHRTPDNTCRLKTVSTRMASKQDDVGEGAQESDKEDNVGSTFAKYGLKGLQDKLDAWKTTPVNIAVTGQSGCGKSSFINRLRGLTPSKEDQEKKDSEGNLLYAKTGVTECTTERKSYEFPGSPLIKLWDLPGAGTEKFPTDTYAADMSFGDYDLFIILTKDRFYEVDKRIATMINHFGKPFFFARTKMDATMREAADDNPEDFSAEDTEAQIREDCRTQLDDRTKEIFLLAKVNQIDLGSGKQVKFPDNDRLKEKIINCQEGLQRTALGKYTESIFSVVRRIFEK